MTRVLKNYPHDFAKEFYEKYPEGSVYLGWELKGPKHTQCSWISCWIAATGPNQPKEVYLVQTWNSGTPLVADRSVYEPSKTFS